MLKHTKTIVLEYTSDKIQRIIEYINNYMLISNLAFYNIYGDLNLYSTEFANKCELNENVFLKKTIRHNAFSRIKTLIFNRY